MLNSAPLSAAEIPEVSSGFRIWPSACCLLRVTWMKLVGAGRMPHIGSNLVDEETVKLVTEWIGKMPKE